MRTRDEGTGVVDRASVLARLGGNERLLGELVEMFLEDAPQSMAAIREAIRQENANQLHLTAHCFCSAIGSFGKTPAFEAARHLEALGQDGDLTRAEELFALLEQTLRQMESVLVQMAAPAQTLLPAEG
jgi:two-component system sensor histidine kinase/response regulator